MASDPKRLMGLGVPYGQAVEICTQIDAGAGNVPKLMGVGFPTITAVTLAASITGASYSSTDLVRVGVPAKVAEEIVSISGGGGSGASLLPVGTRIAVIGHSYEDNGTVAGSTSASSPLIGFGHKSAIGYLLSVMPQLRCDIYWELNEQVISLTGVTGSFPKGSVVTQGSVTGTIVATSATRITVRNVNGLFVSSTAITSDAGGSATTSTQNPSKHMKGDINCMQGEFLAESNGYRGLINRVDEIMDRNPGIVYINGPVNTLVNGVSYTLALTQYKAIYDKIRAHANGANTIVLMANCNPFTTDYTANTLGNRQNIVDFNNGLVPAMQTWGGYGTKLWEIDVFSALFETPTDLATDGAAFVAGTKQADANKMVDQLHDGYGGAWEIMKKLRARVLPLVTSGNWFKTAYSAVDFHTSPTATFSGTGGGKTGTSASGTLPSGLSIVAPSSASTYVCSIIPGDGTDNTHGTAVGKNNLRIVCTNAGVAESFSLNSNANSGGIANGGVGWYRVMIPIWHDGADVIANIQLATRAAIVMQWNSANKGSLPVTMQSEAGSRWLISPPLRLDGSQTQIGWTLTANFIATKTGTQILDICPDLLMVPVSDPSL